MTRFWLAVRLAYYLTTGATFAVLPSLLTPIARPWFIVAACYYCVATCAALALSDILRHTPRIGR